jgi:hypothetical protein
MSTATTEVRLFHVEVPEDDFVDFRQRAEATQRPDSETVADESQGVQLRTLRGFAASEQPVRLTDEVPASLRPVR